MVRNRVVKKKHKKTARMCKECGNKLTECICSYDTILNVGNFLMRRSSYIGRHRKSELKKLRILPTVFNNLPLSLPNLYYTRAGCQIENFQDGPPSTHDAARYIGLLATSEYNEMILSMYSGSNNSAIRCIRAVFEWCIKTIAAVSDLSIITNLDEDRGKAACFQGLLRFIDVSRDKKTQREKVKRVKANFEKLIQGTRFTQEEILLIRRELHTDVKEGIGSIPEELNEYILRYITIYSSEDESTLRGKTAIRYMYSALSEYVHIDHKLIDADPAGTKFFDAESFDQAYKLILSASDVIIVLFVLLLDMDVYHFDFDRKIENRKRAAQILDSGFFSAKAFPSLYALMRSTDWLSPSILDFVDGQRLSPP